jgi:manganese/zinc/iron transport system ATP- binding protein
MEALVNACDVCKLTVAYRDKPVLHKIDFQCPRGVIMGIVGPNGAGKSTLMKALVGLMPAIHGSVEFFGKSFKAVRHRVGYMPQQNSVDWDFPTTVFDVVMMGTYGSLGWFRRPGAAERARTLRSLEHVGISDLADRQIGELSGGQRQRTFLARALVQEPEIYFMDEPLQGVDAKSERAIIDVMRELKEQGKTIVIVHHDLATVREYCDWVTLLNGRVVASGPVEMVFTEENVRTTYEHASALLEFGIQN